MQPLYKIAYEYQHAFDELSANDELSSDIVKDTLAGIGAEFDKKATAVAAMILNLNAEATAIKEAESRMIERRKSIESKAEHLREYLKMNMEAINKDVIKTVEFDIKIKKCPLSVEVDASIDLPPEYIRTVLAQSPDKLKIRDALVSGIEIRGALLVQKNRIEIK
jgi:hypothetical protein